MPKIRVTSVGIGSPLLSASLSWEYPDESLGTRGGCLVLGSGQLPKVRDVRDPVILGVHPSSSVDSRVAGPAGQSLPERVPVYVARDADDDIARRVAAGGFILLVGDSSAGKSRAAFQAVVALPDHVLIVPRDRASLGSALDRACAVRRCVLWLDDLEGYLGRGGLTRAGIVSLLVGKRAHRVVMATLRSAEEAILVGEDAGSAGGSQHRRDIHEVIELAHRIQLPRIFSTPERKRAESLAWDPRISDALAHASEYGVAEYLASGPELMRAWEDAWSANTDPRAVSHPKGAALIAAAVDIRRGGYSSPLPRALLEQVHDHYLEERGGFRLRPESMTDAWAWATSPRRATTALLSPFGDRHVRVFDYLLDRVQEELGPSDNVPDAIMEAALDVSSAADADSIGGIAYAHARYQLAERAFWVAYQARVEELGEEHLDTLDVRATRANMLRDLGRPAEAEAEHRAVVDIATRVYGPEHPQVLECRAGIAFALIRQSLPGKAEAELREVQDISSRVLGPEHRTTILSHHLRAMALHFLGRLDEAEAENRFVLGMWNRKYGPDNVSTLRSRANLSDLLYAAGRLDEAESEAHAASEGMRRIMGLRHPQTLWTWTCHADVLRELGRPTESAREYQEIIDIAITAYGPDTRLVLHSRNGLAFALIRQGLAEEADRELRDIRDIASRALGPGHDLTMASRHLRALALCDLDRPDEAQAENELALDAWVHDIEGKSTEDYTYILYYAGQLDAAERQAGEILGIRTRTLGANHVGTRRARSRLIDIQNAVKRHKSM
jgi:tetratricopeptide (TPR) repeat protein